MGHHELANVIDGLQELVIDRFDARGRLVEVARGRLIGGDDALNTVRLVTPAGGEVEVTLTSRHRVVRRLTPSRVQAVGLPAAA